MHRKIQIKRSRKGTFARFFNNMISSSDAGTETISFLVTDATGVPLRIASTEEQTLFSRNARNNFEFDTSLLHLTGRTIEQSLNFELNLDQQNNIRNSFINKQLAAFGKQSISAVFFESREVSDFFVDIGITRSTDILNTLSIHNNVLDETPTLEAATGVLFGRLEAIQKVKNENGEKIRIPLANVPVAIFNPSDEFPSITSADPDGNRMSLNMKENSSSSLYFNTESFDTDQTFLKDDSAFNVVPQKYKYTATTNEKGEFAILDVPIGEQVFIFEIDLLKQGLTKDEVALNFFPYPAEETPNVDNVPNFFFRQIPVNIVPAWGDFQSGYTELNITVPLDLRKWATYYTCPMVFAGKSIEERINKGYSTPLTFAVRNMALENFPIKRIEIVEIDDLLKKDSEQQLLWEGEFKQIKSRAEFRANDFQAFKLPANLYDPDGIGTSGLKGVWLCAYQIKMFYQGDTTKHIPDNAIYRETGFERDYIGNGAIERSHFDLNRHTRDTNIATFAQTLSAHTGVFPYEKAWTINYPDKYSIPKIPVNRNPNKRFGTYGNPLSFKEPVWLDGDRIGGSTPKYLATGYGLQKMDGSLKPNLFSQRVTAGVIFRYEAGVSWEEQYSNGFYPVLDGTPGNDSKVVGGERYQRVEAGYGYWLRPEGWPRIQNNGWGWEDQILTGDFDSGVGNPIGMSPQSYEAAVAVFTDGMKLAIQLDDETVVRKGTLDIYRVADPKTLVPPGPPFVEKFVKIAFQPIYIQNEHTPHTKPIMRLGNKNCEMTLATGLGHIGVTNKGIVPATVSGVKIEPGETQIIGNGVTSDMELTFPANANYNSDENSYNIATYHVRMYDVNNKDGIIGELSLDVGHSATKGTAVYYVTSNLGNVRVDAKVKDTDDSGNITAVKCGLGSFLGIENLKPGDVVINGIAFLNGEGGVVQSINVGGQTSPDCSDDIPIRFQGGHA